MAGKFAALRMRAFWLRTQWETKTTLPERGSPLQSRLFSSLPWKAFSGIVLSGEGIGGSLTSAPPTVSAAAAKGGMQIKWRLDSEDLSVMMEFSLKKYCNLTYINTFYE
jgi:hypothetical protein